MKNFIRLSEIDNVVTVTAELDSGVEVEQVKTSGLVPCSHKIATAEIRQGEAVRKYAQIIGYASRDIRPGEHVHTHNVDFRNTSADYEFATDLKPVDVVSEPARDTFMGYRRENGKVGTRNYIGILTSVNCSATAARMIASAFGSEEMANYPNVDGVVAFVHGTGCGMAGQGEGFDALQRVLWGYARNPNHAGIVMVGLGCEMNQIDWLLEAYGLKQGPLFKAMNIQDTEGFAKTVEMIGFPEKRLEIYSSIRGIHSDDSLEIRSMQLAADAARAEDGFRLKYIQPAYNVGYDDGDSGWELSASLVLPWGTRNPDIAVYQSQQAFSLAAQAEQRRLIEDRLRVLLDTADAVRECSACGNLDTEDPCRICLSPTRLGEDGKAVLCVVETVSDLWALERSGSFKGRYHVLGGTLSALDGRGPDQLRVGSLLERVRRGEAREVILALSATVDGQTTAHYLAERLRELGAEVSAVAQGVPVGGSLEYLDDGTLLAAMNARRSV